MAKKLEITLIRGLAGKNKNQIVTVKCLGLKKPWQVVVHEDTPVIRGMIHKVQHLVQVRELED